MCDRSKWKPRSYCYSTKKIKSVPRTKWEREITSDEDYWRQYVREKEKNLIVRDSHPNLTRFPSVQRYPRTLCRGIRNNVDANNIDESIGNERKPLVESLTNVPSYRLSSFTEENDFANIREPVVTVLPPAPSKRPTKTFSTRKEERKRALAEDISFRKEFSSLVRVNVRNASREQAKVDETRSREDPSFRENDRPNGEKSSRSRTDETLLKAANKNYLESPDDREAFTFDDIDVNSDLENKSNYPICALKKRTEGNKGSSTDDDFSKYFVRSAREALKRVTKHSRSANREVNKTTKKVARKGRSEKYEKEFINVSSISLKPLFSFDRVEEDVGDDSPRTSLTADFLNGLPKMSHFPRKKRDRCLSCLYKSLEEIGASSRKDAYERRKGREEEGKQHRRDVSVERESNGDVSSDEFEDERNRSDFGAREKVGFAMERSGECSDIAEEKKLGLPSAEEGAERGKTSVDRVTETEGRLPVPELESTCPEGKRIAFKSISASSRGTSDSDEDDSSVDLIEYSSTKSKHRPACHAPTILSHTLEPLRALRSRKSTSVQARVALDESTESPKIVADGKSREIASKGTGQKATLTDTKRGKEQGDSKRVKKLTKVESVSENLITDVEVNEAKEKSLFARSSSCRDFERILRDSTKGTELASPPGLCSLAEDGPFRCLFSKGEIEETLRDLEEREASPTFALSALCDMFLNRISESSDKRDRRRDNVAKRLVKLLVESRRYSNPDKFPSDLIFSSKQRPLLTCQRLRSILPLDSYNLIAPLLGIPEYHPRFSSIHEKLKPAKKPSDKSDSLPDILDDLIVHPPSSRDSAISSETIETTRYNPYGLFLRKERRKAVVWRPLTEFDLKGYDPQATLRMRADKITTDICKEFCDWLRSLGGFERGIDERILKDMFEISFSADACKTTQVNVKEMATVPTDVALARMCHEASVLATTRKQLERDAKAESRPKRTLAFGTSMPIDLLFVPPTNRVRERWLECKNVPRELETMDIVWNGITHLESVQAFVKWLHRHPEVSPPKVFKRAVLPKDVRKFVKKRHAEM
ncbi:uncharacterized protein LOC122636175 [Vespula pensylvanica]|uniref:uncharacterized protein LOC122636175 n=1 Tax=Vespula pensylvanica TaxID=30213 RepID=UPI001CB9E5A0|nr:uncharacterized protein LOC122636175 [Vespula pensylvanica]